MTRRRAGNTITASGSSTYVGQVNAVGKWAPDTPLPADNAQPAVTVGATKDDPDLRPGIVVIGADEVTAMTATSPHQRRQGSPRSGARSIQQS